MVSVHHTICAHEDLRKKWLHDPSIVPPRRGNTPTAPAGDVVKTTSIVKSERQRIRDLRVTLALTTNEEPPEDVTRDAQGVAHQSSIELDIWSRSRIADYLDHNASGQWLRKHYLGIEQERLSLELLQELSRRSLEAFHPPVHENALIERDLKEKLRIEFPRPVGFLIGESGFGKSVAAYQLLQAHVESGGCGFVLGHEILAVSATLDQGIDAALRRLHPPLSVATGATAPTLCSSGKPLLIVVEDINKSDQGAVLLERLVNWSAVNNKEKKNTEVSWQIICPVWPQLITALGDESRKRVASLGLELAPYTREEASSAIQRRAALEGIDIPTLEAGETAEALGYDPLLIALQDLRGVPTPEQVIAKFIRQSTERLESRGGAHLAYEYDKTLTVLASEMLQRKRIDPSWGEILAWFNGSPSQLAMVREMTKQREVIRVSGSGDEARIAFRHDRVKKHLLIAAAINALQTSSLGEEVFSDPFFADVIGAALVHESTPLSTVERAKRSNLLSLFYALQIFREPASETHNAVLEAIDHWLADEGSHSRAHQSLRHWALNVLADTQSSYVAGIVKRFRDRSISGHIARLRNGDLSGGVRLCYAVDPGSGALWRDHCIEYAQVKFGKTLITELDALLRGGQLSEIEIVGGLRLAGHVGDSALADAICACWRSDTERSKRLDEYLWAFAQCGGELTSELLAPVCDSWASLSDKADKEYSLSPRNAVASYGLDWAFWRKLPRAALQYFIERAGTDIELRSNITDMLRGVDDPDAAEFVVRELARVLKEMEGTGKFWPFVQSVGEHWERQQRDRGRIMSTQSRERLRTLWADEAGEKHLRVQAFRLWGATIQPDDLPLLQAIDVTSLLGDDVLRARLKRDDKSAIPLLVDKIKTADREYWWQFARDIWSEELRRELDVELARRRAAVERKWGPYYRTDWIIADLITRRGASTTEELLTEHWEHLRFSPLFVQSALYSATPRLLELVAQAMAECADRAEMVKHIANHWGIRVSGHPGVGRIEQVEALVPYLDDLGDMALYELWELCNKRGWLAFRSAHLDKRLSGKWLERSGLNEDLIVSQLDEELGYKNDPWMDLWVDHHLENGVTPENLIRAVRKWLETQKTPRALEIAASIVIHAGKRADAEVLLVGTGGSQLAADIITDAQFAIRRRRLT